MSEPAEWGALLVAAFIAVAMLGYLAGRGDD